MDRGLYTGASAMIARQVETDVIANNLANVATAGFKRDTVVFKDFPSMMLHRLHDEVVPGPFGTIDLAPPVGRMGTGVEVNDIVTNHSDSHLYQHTGNPLHLAIEGVTGTARGYGFFEVATPEGKMYTRAGNFMVNAEGYLTTQEGALVMGEAGPIPIDLQNFSIEPDGTVLKNPNYSGVGTNQWEDRATVDKLRLVAFARPEGLEKHGYTLYRPTERSGPAETILSGVQIRREELEISNVNIVREMVDLIKANRAYEMAAKVIQAHDTIIGQAVNDVGRVG